MTRCLPLALLAAISLPALAQTTTSTAPAHRSTTARAAAAKAAAAKAAEPALPASIPPLPGHPQPLYSLRYIDSVIGTGPLAEQRKYYTVHYTGWLTDGTKLDSSVDRGAPITFPYGARQVIPGWDTGFEGMHVGGKRRLFIPYQLAYGESGRPPIIPAKANLIFDIELIGQSDTPPTPPPAATPSQPSGSKPADAAPEPASKPATPPPTQSTTPDAQPKTTPHPETR